MHTRTYMYVWITVGLAWIFFADESYAVCHDCPGIIGMANKGRNTNASQFYITLKPCPWMDGQYVAFGWDIYEYHTSHVLSNRGTSRNLCIFIYNNCIILELYVEIGYVHALCNHGSFLSKKQLQIWSHSKTVHRK